MTPAKNGLRILHLIGSVAESAGGPPRSVTQLADAQVRRGHDVIIVAADGPEGLVEPRLARLESYRRLLGNSRGYSACGTLRTARLTRDVDVVHVHGLWMQPTLLALPARRHGARLLVSPRGMLSPSALAQRRWRKRVLLELVERNVLRRADFVVATSNGEAEDVRMCEPSSRVAVVPNGVDDVAKEPHEHRGAVFGYLGRLDPFKRIELLIDAAAGLPAHTLMIAGGGDPRYVSMLRDRCRDLGIQNRVHFLGWLNAAEKRRFLTRVSALALTSRSENFGVAILEALALGTPVVVTPNLPWAANEGRAITVARSTSAAAVREGIASATAEDGYSARGWQALSIAARFSWDVISGDLEDLVMHRSTGKPV